MTLKGISVIIPNYNGRQLLEEILPPLYIALQNTTDPYEVIISDDHSTDDSVNFLTAQYPEVIVIKNEVNKGFSPTINKGIFAAKYDHVLLLNSDVKLTADYFSPLLRYFEKHDTFGVMGRIIGWDDEKVQDAAKYPAFEGAKIKTSGNYSAAEPKPDDWLYSMYLSGANAFVDRRKLLALGGFDEMYAPFYVEDFDLSLRAWRLGWKCYYEHFSVCRHRVSVSIKTKSSKNFVNTIYYRNKMFLHATHLNNARLVLWYAQLLPETLIRIFTGRFWYLRSLTLFFAAQKKVMAAREKMTALSNKYCVNLKDVGDVVTEITASVKDRSIERF